MGSPHPLLPHLAPHDLVLRRRAEAWHLEDAGGRPVCEPLHSLAEARLIGRTFVPARGRVWVCDGRAWSVLDDD